MLGCERGRSVVYARAYAAQRACAFDVEFLRRPRRKGEERGETGALRGIDRCEQIALEPGRCRHDGGAVGGGMCEEVELEADIGLTGKPVLVRQVDAQDEAPGLRLNEVVIVES